MNCVASPHSRGQGRLRSTLFLHSGNGVTTLDWGEFSSGKFGSRIIQHQQPLHLLCSPPAKHPVSQRVFLSDGVFPTPPFVAMALRPIFAPSKWIPIHHLMALRGAEDIGGSFPLSLELGWEHIYFIYTYNCFSLYILFFQTCVDIYMYTDMCVCAALWRFWQSFFRTIQQMCSMLPTTKERESAPQVEDNHVMFKKRPAESWKCKICR